MLQKCVFSTSVEQEGMVERNHIVDFSYKNECFYQSSWLLGEQIPSFDSRFNWKESNKWIFMPDFMLKAYF